MRSARLAVPALVIFAVLSSACADADRVAGSSVATGDTASGVPPTTTPVATPEIATGPGLVLNSTAPDFASLGGWINSEALTMEGLRAENRVVLIDFWTYTCINCIRTLPFVRDWYDKYADRGLTIIGVHTPEFDFEKVRPNVVEAVERYAIEYPVAQDNEMATWRAFNNLFWPAKYLIAADGTLRYQHFGEGSYEKTELQIRRALEDAGYVVSDIPIGGVDAQRLDPYARSITRELYGGYQRNFSSNGLYAAQASYYEEPDATVEYQDVAPEVERNHNQWYLQGLWRNEAEAIVHARDTEQLEDYIAFRFVARSVNVVLRSYSGEVYTVIVEIDGRPLAVAEAGADIRFDELGRSVIVVDGPRMYAVVELPALGDRELRLSSDSSDFSLFAVTFGAYTSGS